MHEAQISLAVRLFTKKDVETLDYTKAVSIYSQTTGPSCKTDARQITYWASRYNNEFEDKLLIYGLYKNKEVVGFLLAFYFEDESLLVVDHIAIQQDKRSSAIFMQFTELVKSHLFDLDININYVFAEIVDDQNGHPMLHSAHAFIRLLKWSKFKVAKIKYTIPSSEWDEPERVTKGTLMVYCLNGVKQIPKERFLILINTLLYKLYLRWYQPFLGRNYKQYVSHLDNIFESYKKCLQSNTGVILNGYLTSEYNPPLEKEDIHHVNTHSKTLRLVVGSSIFIMLMLATVIGLSSYTETDLKTSIFLFVVTTFIFISISSIYNPEAKVPMKELKELIQSFFSKNKP